MAEQKNGVQFSPRRNKHKKHRIKSWLAAAAAVLLVVAALVIAGNPVFQICDADDL